LIGVIVLVRALRTGAWLVSELVFSNPDSHDTFFNWSRGRTAVQVALECGLAFWLLFGTRGMIGLISWARRVGTPASRLDEPNTARQVDAPTGESRKGEARTAEAQSPDGTLAGHTSVGGQLSEELNQ
jgi:hypothetical protein